MAIVDPYNYNYVCVVMRLMLQNILFHCMIVKIVQYNKKHDEIYAKEVGTASSISWDSF